MYRGEGLCAGRGGKVGAADDVRGRSSDGEVGGSSTGEVEGGISTGAVEAGEVWRGCELLVRRKFR